ncbi:MAG: hypothetical protein RIT45_3693 [Pseudomonadota bacterium]
MAGPGIGCRTGAVRYGVGVPMAAVDTQRIERLRRDLMRKGMAVNEALVALKANQNAKLLDLELPHEQKPGLRKEEKLRMFLDQIIRAQRRLGTPDYGVCVDCGRSMPDAALDDTPWLEQCDRCAARESAGGLTF